MKFVQSADPDNPTAAPADSERLVDYSGFTYNRSQTFQGQRHLARGAVLAFL